MPFLLFLPGAVVRTDPPTAPPPLCLCVSNGERNEVYCWLDIIAISRPYLSNFLVHTPTAGTTAENSPLAYHTNTCKCTATTIEAAPTLLGTAEITCPGCPGCRPQLFIPGGREVFRVLACCFGLFVLRVLLLVHPVSSLHWPVFQLFSLWEGVCHEAFKGWPSKAEEDWPSPWVPSRISALQGRECWE